MECEWNGASLRVKPYYTLPAPGRYAVTLKGSRHTQEADLIVTEKKELISLQSITALHLAHHGGLTIRWHQQIYDETAISEKKLIHSL